MERIKLNLIPSGVAPIVHLSQYDDGRKFGIDLFEGESVYVLDGTETLTVNSRKPDGHVVTLTVTNTGTSSLDVDTVEQLTAVHGVSYAKLQIVKGSVTIATLPFLIDVSRDPLENGDPSESFIQNLRTQIAEGVAEEVATQYDSSNVIFDNEPTDNHGIGYTVTSEGIKTAIDNAFDYDNTASGSLVHIEDGADNIPVKSLVSQIVAVESGSGEKSPDNSYTISGFDSGVVPVCGVNLWDETTKNGYWNTTNGNYVSVTGQLCSNDYIPVKENTAYYFYKGSTTNQSEVLFYDKSKTFIGYLNYSQCVNKAFTTPSNCAYITFNLGSNYGATYLNNISFNYPSTDTQYHAYNGNTYTFAFGQTVYGGNFDNKGNLVISHGMVDLGTLNWSDSDGSGLHNSSDISDILEGGYAQDLSDYLCEIFRPKLQYVGWASLVNGEYGTNNKYIRVKWTDISSGADFKTFVTGKKLIYPLANPITLSITSQDIPTLLGENNIFSNCGDVEVNYYTSKSNDILEFIDSEIGKKNGTNIPIEANSQDSIKDYIDNEVSSTKDYVDNGLSGKVDTSYLDNMLVVERKFRDVTFDSYYQSIEIDVTKSGYTPIGVVGFQTNTVGALFFRCNLTGNTLYIGLVARDGTTPITGTIATYADVLYVKNS